MEWNGPGKDNQRGHLARLSVTAGDISVGRAEGFLAPVSLLEEAQDRHVTKIIPLAGYHRSGVTVGPRASGPPAQYPPFLSTQVREDDQRDVPG